MGKKKTQGKAAARKSSKAAVSRSVRKGKRANQPVRAGGNPHVKMWSATVVAIVVVIGVWVSSIRSTVQQITEQRPNKEKAQNENLKDSLWQSVGGFQNSVSEFKAVLSAALQKIDEETQQESPPPVLSDEQLSQLARQIKEGQREGVLPQGYDSQKKEDVEIENIESN